MPTILIKKYGNRRLYDTAQSRYVTLEELAATIRTGVDLRVVDAQTNHDLTQATLVQIVVEGSDAAKFLPAQLLTQMIRLSDDALAEFFSRYVTSALEIYLQAKRYSPLGWFGPSPFASASPTAPPAAMAMPMPPPPPEPATEVAAMRSELDELKQLLRNTLGKRDARGKKRRS